MTGLSSGLWPLASGLQFPPSDTFFTSPPHFRWWIILYFFVGGISGGALLVASLLRLFGAPEDRHFIRLGVYISFVGCVVSGVLLIVDLGVPLRFWHMLVQNNTGRPMFKWWSPMSVGAWGLLVFGFFSFLATLRALREDGRFSWSALRFIDGVPISVFGAVGGIVGGLFLAGYTGVLLSVTNRPIWADSTWLGLLFLLSGISTSVAALLLVAHAQGVRIASTEERLRRFDRIALILELIVIVLFVISLGAVARAFLNAWGVLLVLGVIGVGILKPLTMGRDVASHNVATASVLVLFGGFVLRVVVLLGSDQVHVAGAQVFR
ncbi:MAG TPA: NrfD/PsrC family molybdoenzyme membrane anchor subunit [Gemmatimonadaceae bacterium]